MAHNDVAKVISGTIGSPSTIGLTRAKELNAVTTLPLSSATGTGTGTGSGRLVLRDPAVRSRSNVRPASSSSESPPLPSRETPQHPGIAVSSRMGPKDRSTGVAHDAQPALAAVVSSFQAW